MSYLDVPRLHFAGRFVARPSTLNNTGSNFEPGVTNPYPSWNPKGNHFWQFLDCSVKTAVNNDGPVTQDPVLNATVLSTDTPSPAKLVDLDTEQQLVSQIWGLQIKVAVSETDYFVGNFRAAAFNDINFGREVNGSGDGAASAYFQSVLDEVTWGSEISSPFLQQLQGISPNSLSIKFVVDRFDQDAKLGRIVGTIGPYFDGEPPNFVLGRALRPAAQSSPLWFGYARVDQARERVLVDLGNSIPTTAPDGTPPNLGTLQVAIIPPSGSPTILGNYDYSQTTYEATAGIQEYQVSADQLSALATTPLGVIQTRSAGAPPVVPLQEGANGTYVNATQMVYRMNPGEVAEVELIALQFGERAANQLISLTLNASLLQPAQISAAPPTGQTPTAMIPVATPTSALTFTTAVTTGEDGSACFQMTASDPDNPREFIDGQVYNVAYSWADDQDPSFPPDPNGALSVLVFDTYQGNPTWEDIKPFMAQYAKLYPFMDSLVPPGLDDPTVYQKNPATFQEYLSFPITDPRFMPVTRDMSRDKRRLLLEWLDAGAPDPATSKG